MKYLDPDGRFTYDKNDPTIIRANLDDLDDLCGASGAISETERGIKKIITYGDSSGITKEFYNYRDVCEYIGMSNSDYVFCKQISTWCGVISMKRFLKVLKILCVLLFFFSVFYVFYYKVTINDKMDASFLNGYKIENGKYYIADINKIYFELEKEEWDKLYKKTIVLKTSVIYLMIYLPYVWFKYLIIPNIKKMIRKLEDDKE